MIAPPEHQTFDEIKYWAWDIARDLCWAYRRKETSNGIEIRQFPGERSAVECWLVCCLMSNVELLICSPSGVVLRAPTILNAHLDQIEMLPIPLPLDESTICLPDIGNSFELDEHTHFNRRFTWLSWTTGTVDTTNAESKHIVSMNGRTQFSRRTQRHLSSLEQQRIEAVRPFVGWSLCIKNDALGESVSDLWSAFGVDADLLERLGIAENTNLQAMVGSTSPRNRKRDRALEVYNDLFPEGHEAESKSLKEATNEVSDALGHVVSVDTMRRALGKKK